MITVHRASERFRTEQAGITTWHCFSSGPHYDPDNLGHGPVIACDEHYVDPGAGFAPHRHARVELLSWVVDGTLRHSGPGTGRHLVVPGRAQYQLAGGGIEHEEVNASDSEPLQFVQLWLRSDEELPDYDVGPPPVRTATGRFDVLTRASELRLPRALSVFAFVAAGRWTVGSADLGPGDSLRADDERITVEGAGQLLVVAQTPPG